MDYLKQYTIDLCKDPATPRNIRQMETITGTTITKLEKLGFKGCDICLETSLFEYGMAWIEDEGDWHFIHSINVVDGQFDNTAFAIDTDWRSEFNWIDRVELDGFLSFIGMTEEEFEEMPFTQKVFDLVQYYGVMNIFGESHWGGFYIFKDGRQREQEYFDWINGKHGY